MNDLYNSYSFKDIIKFIEFGGGSFNMLQLTDSDIVESTSSVLKKSFRLYY